VCDTVTKPWDEDWERGMRGASNQPEVRGSEDRNASITLDDTDLSVL